MSPTCSNTDLAGRKVLFTVALTICSSGRERGRLGTAIARPLSLWDGIGWYVHRALGGHRTQARRRPRAVAAGLAAGALALALAACGDDSSEAETTEADRTYPVRVAKAEFPTRQRLGETNLLRLAVRNAGEDAIPQLTVTFAIAGEEGRDSKLPFGFRDPRPDLAQPDRPVWVLSEGYPRLAGSSESAGAETASLGTFDFGRLEPFDTVEAVWRLSAVKAGDFDLHYEVGAGLGGKARAETLGGGDAGGSFAVRVTTEPPETVVSDSGRVEEAPANPTEANR